MHTRVFYYHGVIEKIRWPGVEQNFTLLSDFQSHLTYLKMFPCLALGDFIHDATTNRTPTKPNVLITFDDGYRNNLMAAEILQKNKIPWTLFVSTGGLGHGKILWPAELCVLLMHGHCDKVELFRKRWKLKTFFERRIALEELSGKLKSLPTDQKNIALNSVREQFPLGETQRLLNLFSSHQMLSQNELVQLSRSGVEIGSHGIDHEIHHSEQIPEVREWEIADSKKRIEELTSLPCRSFAFPNGDFNDNSPEELRRANYEVGFTTEEILGRSAPNPYLVPRMEWQLQSKRLRFESDGNS